MNIDDLRINAYQYEQYNSVWCKVVALKHLIEEGISEANDETIIKALIEHISMVYTPERWCGHFQLEKDKWHSTTTEHIKVADEMLEACNYYQKLEIQEAIDERDEYLSWYGFDDGMASVAKATGEKLSEAKTLLNSWYKRAVIDEKHQLKYIDFTAHQALKDKFCHQLFSDNSRFYINKTAEEAKVCLRNENKKRIAPAIIGLDTEKAAMMWFNY